jgi:putative ABC transport system permease protein
MHGFLTDLRHSVRGLLRQPGFAATAILALAIGVGSSTAMFSVVDAALLRPLPYTLPDRLIEVTSVNDRGEHVPMGAVEFFALEKHARTVEAIGVFAPHSATVVSASGARHVKAADLSASLFATLGIAPAHGRAFETSEDLAGGESAAIVSDSFWRRELGADPAAIGRTLLVDHKSVRVVGVLPPDAAFPRLERYELFLSLGITPEWLAMPAARGGLYAFARLKSGVGASAAKAEMDGILRSTSGYTVAVEPLLHWITGEAAPALKAALAAALLLLAIACANVMLLLLMRGVVRGRETAVRAALGGGPRRMALQQVAEALLLSIAGGVLGLLFAKLAVDMVVAFSPDGIPRLRELRVDWGVASFAIVTSLISGALAGIASAAHALRRDLFLVLKEGGAGGTPGASRSHLREGLVIAQLSIALVLTTGAGLLVRSLQRFANEPVGVETKNAVASFVHPQGVLAAAASSELLDSARAIPGVVSAGMVGFLPLDSTRSGWDDSVFVEGRNPTDTAPDTADLNWFTPGYLASAGIHLIKGRDFTGADTNAAVAIVSATFVSRFLSGREPIGAFVRSSDWMPTTFTVVGVIDDVRQWGPGYPASPQLYLPQGHFARKAEPYRDGGMLLVKSSLPLGQLERALHAAAAPLGSQIALGTLKPLDEYLSSHFRQRRFQLDLALAFALAALLLAGLGVYGAMAFSVVQRRRELAVRTALGAQRGQLFALVLARGARIAALGICCGVAGALVFSRFLSALVYGVGERDPLTYALVAATLGAVTLAATLLPAFSASHADPMTAIRSE